MSPKTKVGPLVFLAMVNDVTIDAADRWKFVDDTTVRVRSTDNQSGIPTIMEGVCKAADSAHVKTNASKRATRMMMYLRPAAIGLPLASLPRTRLHPTCTQSYALGDHHAGQSEVVSARERYDQQSQCPQMLLLGAQKAKCRAA